MKLIRKERVEIDICRPAGNIETKDISGQFSHMNDILFRQIVVATRGAGRGEVLRYRNIPAEVEIEESDYFVGCERCGTRIDTRSAKHQKESFAFRGSRCRATTHYCDSCWNLLRAIGAGERTELEERANAPYDNTPETKTDF